jgi:hypothetical protein
MKTEPLRLALAKLLHCPPDAILSYREYPDGTVVVINPGGAKQRFSADEIRTALPAAPRKRGDA